MFLHLIWTTAMPCFLDFHTAYFRDYNMFRMLAARLIAQKQKYDEFTRIRRTVHWLNRGLSSKYWCMLTRSNTYCPLLTYQNWLHITNLQRGWDHVMSIIWLNIGLRPNFIEIVHSKMQSSHSEISYQCTFANMNMLYSSYHFKREYL